VLGIVKNKGYAEIIQKVCKKLNREGIIIDFDVKKSELEKIPLIDFIISIPMCFEDENDLEKITQNFDKWIDDTIKFHEKIILKLRLKKYMSILTTNFYYNGKMHPLSFNLASKLGDCLKLLDEQIFIYNTSEMTTLPKSYYNEYQSKREHFYSFYFRREEMNKFKAIDQFLS